MWSMPSRAKMRPTTVRWVRSTRPPAVGVWKAKELIWTAARIDVNIMASVEVTGSVSAEGMASTP